MKQLLRVARILLATLQEIFDEAPYARYLKRAQVSSSHAAYAAFCQEQEAMRSRRPKCC